MILLLDREERVHSQTNLDNSNQSSFVVTLPQNIKTELLTKELISWAYWVGVGSEADKAYEIEKREFIKNDLSKMIGTIDPLSGLAIGGFTSLYNPPSGEDVKYNFITSINDVRYDIVEGKGVSSFGRIEKFKQGSFGVILMNDNMLEGINVKIKITAFQIIKHYKNTPYKVLNIKETKFPVLDF